MTEDLLSAFFVGVVGLARSDAGAKALGAQLTQAVARSTNEGLMVGFSATVPGLGT